MKRTDSILQQFYMSRLPKAQMGGLHPSAQNGGKAKTHKPTLKEISQIPNKDIQGRMEEWLGNPMQLAQQSANRYTKPGEDQTDNIRHPMAGRYVSEAIQDKLYHIPIVSQIAGFLGASAAGLGHELIEPNRGTTKRPYSIWDTVKEGAEDQFNNMVGAAIGSTPFISSAQKDKAIKYLSDHNMIPDGYRDKDNMYKKHQMGGLTDKGVDYSHERTYLLNPTAPTVFNAERLKGKKKVPYEPTSAVKNTKAALALSSLAPSPLIAIPSALAGSVYDFGTATKYYLDDQKEKASEDFIQGVLGLLPTRFLKGHGLKGDAVYKNLKGVKSTKIASDVKTITEGDYESTPPLSFATGGFLSGVARQQKKQAGAIKDDRGQWAHPGEITEIGSNNITMQGVPYPVLGIGADGQRIMMEPGEDYTFNKGPVTEYPIMKNGGQMIKRADGSYSQRGLWDNIRANKGSGKKPTKEMLEEEKKIKSKKYADGGTNNPGFEVLPEYDPWYSNIVDYARDIAKKVVPTNARSLGRMTMAAVGLPTGNMVNKSDFSKEQLKLIYEAAMNAKKRTGQNQGGIMYSDYGKKYANIHGRGIINMAKDSFLDPGFSVATTLGRFNYNANPDGSISLTDVYDFNDEEKGVVKRVVKTMDDKLGKDPRKNVAFNVSPVDFKRYGGIPIMKKGGTSMVRSYQQMLNEEYGANLNEDGIWGPKTQAAYEKFVTGEKKPGATPAKKQDSSKPVNTPRKLQQQVISENNLRPTKGYIDLSKVGLDPFSKEGIEKAKELSKKYPGSKFICTAEGCAEIASNAARAYDVDFGRANAWDFGNRSNVVYQNPNYADKITGKQGVLENPNSYDVPVEILNSKNTLIGLNRNNNLITDEGSKISRLIQPLALMTGRGKAKDKKNANDSYDYANPDLYPNSRGYEHIGFSLGNKQLLHGTGKGKDHPAFYIIDDMTDGIDLSGYGKYEPVEAMQPDNFITSTFKNAKRFLGMKYGGTNNPGFEALPEYVQAKILANMGYGGYYNPIMALGGDPITEKKTGLSFWKGSQNQEANITPTGKSNLFSNNKYGFDETAFTNKMNALGLDTSSNLALQQDMMRKYPDLVNNVMKEYGNTNAGRFDDGILGARIISMDKQIPSPAPPSVIPPTNVQNPYENPNKGYVVNVRGDDNNGAYYFPTSENFDKLSSVIPGSKEYRNNYKGATVNMTNANFMNQYGNNYKEALGQAYKRNPQNPEQFIPMQKNGGSTFSGNAWYENGGPYIPEYIEMAYGGIHLDPAKKGTFKAQATRMGMGVQEAASAILNAPEGKYSPAMRKKANFAHNFAKQQGGLVDGTEMEVTPEQAEWLKSQGYEFEII